MAEVIGRALIRVLPETAEFAVRLRNDLKRTFQTITDSFAVLGTQAAAGAGLALGGVAFNLAGAFALIPAAAASATVALGALAVGFQGVGKAIKDAGDPKKFAKDLEKLSPEARKAAIAVKDLGVQAGAFRVAVQDALFRDLDTTITRLGNVLLPGIKKNFVDIATEVNHGARAFAIFAGSKQSIADLNTVFGNTKEAIRSLIPAGIGFSTALRDIITVGSNSIPGLADGIRQISERFAAFIAKARDSGQLSAFFERGVETLKKLLDIVKNLGQGILSVFKTASNAGDGFLDSLDKIARAFKNFVSSDQGKAGIVEFLDSAKQAAIALAPVLKAVFSLFATEIAPILADIGVTIGPAVTEFIRTLGLALHIAEPGIKALAEGFAALVRGVAPALPALGRLASVIGESLGKVLTELAPVLGNVVRVLADALAKALSDPKLIQGIIDMGKAFADLIVALAPVLPSLAELAGEILTALADILSVIAQPLADIIKLFVDALAPILPDLVKAFVDLVKAMMPLVKAILPPLVDLIKALLPILKPLFELLAVVFKILTPLIKLLGLVIEALAKVVEFIVKVIDAAIKLSNFFVKALVGDTAGAVDALTTKISGEAVPAIEDGFGHAGVAVDDFKGIVGTLRDAVAQVTDDASGSMEKFQHNTATALDGTLNSATTFAIQVVSTLFPSFESVGKAGSGAFQQIVDAANRSFLVTVKQSREVLMQVAGIFGNADFSAAGSAIAGSLAAGMTSTRSRLVVQQAARQLMEIVSSWFPHSPAKVGPFSGTGWTPFRGFALVQGFAEGIELGTSSLSAALGNLFGSASAEMGGVGAPNVPLRVGAFGTSGGGAPGASSAGAGAAAGAGDTHVQVFIGDQELTQLVNGVVTDRDRALRRRALSGTGRAL